MKFASRGEEENLSGTGGDVLDPIGDPVGCERECVDGDLEFLGDKRTGKVFLSRNDVAGEPEHTDFLEEWKYDAGDGIFNTQLGDGEPEDVPERLLVKIERGFQELIDQIVLVVFALRGPGHQ